MKSYKIIVLLFGMLGLVSCKKWLEVNPKTEMKANVLFSNQAGFRDALIGIYSLMTQPNAYGSELSMASVDIMAQTYDNVRSVLGHYYENTAKYLYTDAPTELRFSNIWKQQYKAIVNANIILGNIEEKKSVFESGNYNVIKGETLALRGFLHFDLLRLFAAAPVTGMNQKAIPYVNAYTNVPFPQSTVAEVLDKVILDLEEGRTLLRTVDPYGPNHVVINKGSVNEILNNRSFRMNYYAATGILARVYLYKNDKVKALEYAKEVINSGLFEMFKLDGATVVQASDYVFPTEQLFCLNIPGLKTKFADLYFPEVTQTVSPYSLTINNTVLNQLFPAGINTDYRNNWFAVATATTKRITKYSFNEIIPMVKKSEMYLIAAECEPATSTAVTSYLNVLRAHRGLSGLDPTTTTKQMLDTEIGMEYRREFIAEGQLFYYFKRLNVAKLPTIAQFANPAAVYVLPIPAAEKEFGNIQ